MIHTFFYRGELIVTTVFMGIAFYKWRGVTLTQFPALRAIIDSHI